MSNKNIVVLKLCPIPYNMKNNIREKKEEKGKENKNRLKINKLFLFIILNSFYLF